MRTVRTVALQPVRFSKLALSAPALSPSALGTSQSASAAPPRNTETPRSIEPRNHGGDRASRERGGAQLESGKGAARTTRGDRWAVGPWRERGS